MTKKGLEIAKLDNSNVPTALEKLDKEIASLKHIQETAYQTSGILPAFGDIKNEMLISNLIRAASSVMGMKLGYDNAAKWLGIEEYPVFEIAGYSPDQWKHDLLLRKAVIEHKDDLDTLNEFKSEMSKYLSEEDQKSMLIKRMEAYFSRKQQI
jgi:hypothetical protein